MQTLRCAHSLQVQRNIKALKVGNSFIPSLTSVRRMTAGKLGGFVVLLHTFLLTHSAVVKAFGADLKNEVAVALCPRPRFTLRTVVFSTSSHLVFCLHGDGATGASETTNACKNAFRRPGKTAAVY